MINYSQTYAAAITTFAPLVVLILGSLGVDVLATDIIAIFSAAVSFIGFVWQIIHRYNQGGVTIIGSRRE